jgi:hypothetical protein
VRPARAPAARPPCGSQGPRRRAAAAVARRLFRGERHRYRRGDRRLGPRRQDRRGRRGRRRRRGGGTPGSPGRPRRRPDANAAPGAAAAHRPVREHRRGRRSPVGRRSAGRSGQRRRDGCRGGLDADQLDRAECRRRRPTGARGAGLRSRLWIRPGLRLRASPGLTGERRRGDYSARPKPVPDVARAAGRRYRHGRRRQGSSAQAGRHDAATAVAAERPVAAAAATATPASAPAAPAPAAPAPTAAATAASAAAAPAPAATATPASAPAATAAAATALAATAAAATSAAIAVSSAVSSGLSRVA